MAAFDEEHQARQDGESLGHAGAYRARRPHSFRADQATTPEAAEVVRHVGHLAVGHLAVGYLAARGILAVSRGLDTGSSEDQNWPLSSQNSCGRRRI